MRPTMKRIAERCGCAISTVSHILGTRGDAYSPEMRDRIWKAARELGYRPNSMARAMREGRFGSLALLLSTLDNRSYVPQQLLDGAIDAAAKQNLSLTLAKLPDGELAADGFVPKILEEFSADGLIVNFHHTLPKQLDKLLREFAVPSVWINVKQRHDSAYPDDRSAARRATEYLLKNGHERIAYADFYHGTSTRTHHYSARDRFEGYREAMKNAGLKIIRWSTPELVPSKERLAFTRELLGRGTRPTAVVSYSSWSAFPIFIVCSQELGMRVPDDIEIMNFGDLTPDMECFPIKTLLLPWDKVAHSAVALIQKKLGKGGKPQPSISVPFGSDWD